MITSEKMRFYWEYFRTLCKRFDNTRGYIDHSLNEYNQLKYGDVCSWEFQQILILTAVEFENNENNCKGQDAVAYHKLFVGIQVVCHNCKKLNACANVMIKIERTDNLFNN